MWVIKRLTVQYVNKLMTQVKIKYLYHNIVNSLDETMIIIVFNRVDIWFFLLGYFGGLA